MKLAKLTLTGLVLAAGFSINANETTIASDTQVCPPEFFQLPLHPQASLCLVFDETLPASLTYHAKADQNSTKTFYTDQLGQAQSEESLKGRIVLQYKNGEQTIVISPDGAGSQVDILVKNNDQA